MRRERGSICLYVAAILVALGLLTAGLVPLASGYGTRQSRRADELRARLAFEAGVAKVKSSSLAMTLVVPSSVSISVSGASGTLNVAANDTQLANTLLVTGTVTVKGRSYRYSRVIGARQPSPFLFALFCNGALTTGKTVTGASGWGGDVFSNTSVSFTSSSNVVNGNLASVGTINNSGGTVVTGRSLTNQPAIAWPTVNATDYYNKATSLSTLGASQVVLTNANVNGVAFGAPLLSNEYPIYYYNGDLSLQGTISGKGTIFVKGNLTVPQNIRYASSSDRVAIVVKGNVNVLVGTDTMDGYLFCGGSFTNSKATAVTRGAWVVNGFSSDKNLTIVRDDAVMNDVTEAVRLRLPYYWP